MTKFMTLSEFRDGGYRDITEPVTVLSVRGRVDVVFVAMPPTFDPGTATRSRPSGRARLTAGRAFGPLGGRPRYVAHELLALLAEGPQTYRQLAGTLGRSVGAAKILVKRLECQGLVLRRQSGGALSPVRVHLTERAAAAVRVATKVHAAEGANDDHDRDGE